MADVITLSAAGHHGAATAEIDLAAGCRVAQITVRGRRLLVDPATREASSTGWGSYPMAPWAGRVRHGRFRFLGEDHQLTLNRQDGPDDDPLRRHAIHGTVYDRAWTVETRTETELTASCALTPPASGASGWPFGGVARQTLELLDGQLCCHLSIEVDHTTQTPFLGELGWHPWFRRPDHLSFHPDAMYERDEIGLPTGRLVAPTERPWDDCFVNTAPVTLHYDRADEDTGPGDGGDECTLTLSSDCDHWVVYTPSHAICCEPQSGPPDAFNIRPRLVTHSHPLRRTMNIAW